MKEKHKQKLDRLWSKKVKEKAGYRSELSGKTKQLESHHIVGRRKRSTRWLIENGICLTKEEHAEAHRDPKGFKEKLNKIRVEFFYEDMQIRSDQNFFKGSYETVKSYLEGELKDYL